MDKLIIDQIYNEQVRVAVINEAGQLQQIMIEKVNRQICKGNLYVGRVQHIEKSLNAAFIDIGLNKAGFLPLDDVNAVDDQTVSTPIDVRVGDLVAVQVLKDSRGQKGPMLTANISLSGHFVVLVPYANQACIGVSKRIGPPAERKRLKTIIEEMNLPEDVQIIVRTASIDQDLQDIKKDIKSLLKLWKMIQEKVHAAKGIELIYEEGSTIYKALKNFYTRDVEAVLVEGEELHKTTKKFMKSLLPTHVSRVLLWQESEPAFYRFKIDDQLEQILHPKVDLPSGGNIVIQQTESMCTVDVNSAHARTPNAILETNLEAADEIARQIRLRNIAGIIAIDFIEVEPASEEDIYGRFKTACKIDKAKINMARINEFGVLMLTRQRTELGLSDSHMMTCPHCLGYGSVQSFDTLTLHILKALERAGLQKHIAGKNIQLVLHPIAGDYLSNQKRQIIASLEKRFNTSIHIVCDSNLDLSQYKVEVKTPTIEIIPNNATRHFPIQAKCLN
ncbi:MAG: ribonuclease E/G [Pseudomonadota bacterium]